MVWAAQAITRTNVDKDVWCYIEGLVQERRNSSAWAMELCLFCNKPSNERTLRKMFHIYFQILSVQSSIPGPSVHSVAPIVLDGFLRLAQMIAGMRGCVECRDFWPWLISWRSFGHKTAEIWYILLCQFYSGYRSGVGVTKTISSVLLFSQFFRFIKIRVTYGMAFIFGRCLYSLAVATSVQYRCDLTHWPLGNLNETLYV